MKLLFKWFPLLFLLSLESYSQTIKKDGATSFELRGKILCNGKPLEAVKIRLGKVQQGFKDWNFYYSSNTGDYSVRIMPFNSRSTDYYEITYEKNEFRTKTIWFYPGIEGKTDDQAVVHELPVEMMMTGTVLPPVIYRDTNIFIASTSWASLSWSKEKHQFVLNNLRPNGVDKINSGEKEFSPKVGEKMTLNNIFFDPDKSKLLPDSYEELNKLGSYLNKSKETAIEISGHTDNTGSEEQNKALSTARAKTVADYLTSKGIDKLRVSYNGYGSAKPIAGNDTEEGKKQNRRVEFIIKKR